MEEQVIRIDEILEVLKKRWRLIVIITLLATLVSATLSFFVINPKYEASTKVFIGKENSENKNYNQSDVLMYQQLMKTYAEAIKTKDLIVKATKKAKVDMKPEAVLSNLSIVPVANTQILQIKFKSKDPKEAADLIKAITDEFINASTELVPNGNIKIIEEVTFPEKPVSPNKLMNIAIAFLLGLIVSIGLVFLLEFLDNTFKTKEQLERELDIPVIGVIPTIDEI